MLKNRFAMTAVVLGGLVLGACDSSASQQASPSGEHNSQGHNADAASSRNASTITTKLLDFTPAKLTVPAGTTVVWQAADGIGHTVTTGTFTVGDDGLRSAEQPDGILDKPLAEGKNVSHSFNKPGTYTYYCSIHKGMDGEVTVTP